jgi:hypothetical protein
VIAALAAELLQRQAVKLVVYERYQLFGCLRISPAPSAEQIIHLLAGGAALVLPPPKSSARLSHAQCGTVKACSSPADGGIHQVWPLD